MFAAAQGILIALSNTSMIKSPFNACRMSPFVCVFYVGGQNGLTALDWAKKNGHADIVRLITVRIHTHKISKKYVHVL